MLLLWFTGESASKKIMTSKDANLVGQKNTTKTKAARHTKTSAPKKKTTSKRKTTNEVSVAAVTTYNNFNNVPSAAQATKQASINARQAALDRKDYSVEENSSGPKKKTSLSYLKSSLKKKKTCTKSTPKKKKKTQKNIGSASYCCCYKSTVGSSIGFTCRYDKCNSSPAEDTLSTNSRSTANTAVSASSTLTPPLASAASDGSATAPASLSIVVPSEGARDNINMKTTE